MVTRRSNIKYFVNGIMNQEDVDNGIQSLVQVISNSYGESFKCMVETLKINKETIIKGTRGTWKLCFSVFQFAMGFNYKLPIIGSFHHERL